ncbi:MAG: TlpA family protein disulfide reductase [Acidobacteria bacterium]|nr:TlpA family protein disulfide reductase [Acidobacteriota bacterium]
MIKREVLKAFAFLAVVVIAVGSLAACGTSGSADTVANGTANGDKKPNMAWPEGAKSEYPMLDSALAKAPMEADGGSTFTVEDRKGKVLLLNLWAIWCVPCKVEMPELVKLQDEHRDKGFQVIGLNVGNDDMEPEDFGRMKEFAGTMNLNYELVRINNQTTDDYARVAKFAGVPLSVVVDREGRMRGVFKGASPKEIQKMKETVATLVNE